METESEGLQMYNQYMPGYTAYPNYQQSYAQTRGIIRVNGENGARSIRLAPNSEEIALDTTAPIAWLCRTDGAGYLTVEPYDISPHKTAPQTDISDIEKRIARLEALVNDKPDASGAKSSKKPANAE